MDDRKYATVTFESPGMFGYPVHDIVNQLMHQAESGGMQPHAITMDRETFARMQSEQEAYRKDHRWSEPAIQDSTIWRMHLTLVDGGYCIEVTARRHVPRRSETMG